MGKILKNWGSMIVAIIAVVVSALALYNDDRHHEEAIELGNMALEIDIQHYDEAMELGNRALEADEQHHDEAMELGNRALEADMQHHEDAMELGNRALEAEVQHDKRLALRDDLSRLYVTLEEQKEWLDTLSEEARKVGEPWNDAAINHYRDAELKMFRENYPGAREDIESAYSDYSRCRNVVSRSFFVILPNPKMWIPR